MPKNECSHCCDYFVFGGRKNPTTQPCLTREKNIKPSSIALRYMIPFHTDTNMKVLAFTTCVQRSDDSRILQFALRIAFRCVLHRHGNLDIHRWKFSFRFWMLYPDLRQMNVFYFYTRCVYIKKNKDFLSLYFSLQSTKFKVCFCVNDPSAGSPTDTLLRLLVVPNGRVYLTSRNLAASVQKVHQTIRYYKRRAVCTNGRDIINASWWLALTRNSSFKIYSFKELSLTRLVLIRLPEPFQARKYFLSQPL
jgi:hypothetical protein